MTMKNNGKFEGPLTCHFKIDMTNLTNLTQALKNLKTLHFYGLLLTKVCNFLAKKYRRVMFHGIEY